jgi:hypothetical protein
MTKLIIAITNFDKSKEKDILELLATFATKAKIPVKDIHYVIQEET